MCGTSVSSREQAAHVRTVMVEGCPAVLADLGLPGPGRGGRAGAVAALRWVTMRGKVCSACSALLCASLYAFAAGAAAFAGERETGTLRLLDILPVDRRVVWAGKVSFALVTTLALTLVLLAMAAMSTDRWKPQGSLSVWEALSFGLIVLVALGWGLFWSAILSNALTAAVTAICCTGLSLSVPDADARRGVSGPLSLCQSFVLWQLFVILATMIASNVIFARAMSLEAGTARVPVAHRGEPDRIGKPNAGADSSSSRPSPRCCCRCRDRQTECPRPWRRSQSPRRSWVVEARALAWQTMKEGWRTWCLLAAIGLVAPMLIFLSSGYLDLSWIVLLSIGVALVAGASVFGLENRARTHRFLTHHGARPGLVWLVKLAVWSVGLAVIWGPLALVAKIACRTQSCRVAGPIENWLAGVLIIPLFFGVAQLCGMAIRRGITAVVIALVIGLALAVPLDALVVAHMLPVQGLLVIPAGLLGGLVGVERRLAAGAAGPRAMDSPWPAPYGHVRIAAWAGTRVFAPGASPTSARSPHRRPGSTRHRTRCRPSKTRPTSTAKRDAGWLVLNTIHRNFSSETAKSST